MLTTDRRKLIELVSSLRIEIDIFLANTKLQSHPTGNDEPARSRFLGELFSFLKEATDMTESIVQNHLLFSDTPLAAPTRPLSVVSTRSFSVPPFQSRGRPRYPRSRTFTPRPVTPFYSGRTTPFPYRTPRFTPPLPEHHHSLWFRNAPPEALPHLVAVQIYGAPLESLKWFPHYTDPGYSFLINFFTHSAASEYLSWVNSSSCTMRFPGLDASWRPAISWSENPNGIKGYVWRAAHNAVNPARRVLLFRGWPEEVARGEFKERLLTLEEQCRCTVFVDRFTVSGETAELVVGRIGTAMMIVEWLENGWLGEEFEGCQVEYGRDLSDQPYPEVMNTTEPLSITSHRISYPAPSTVGRSTPHHLPPCSPPPQRTFPVSAPAPYRLIDIPDWVSPHFQSHSVSSAAPSPIPSPVPSLSLMTFPDEAPESPVLAQVSSADDFSDVFFAEWSDSVF